jgi:hypothetical protein
VWGGAPPPSISSPAEVEDFFKRNPPLPISGQQLAADFHTLKHLLQNVYRNLPDTIYGPDACCETHYQVRCGLSARKQMKGGATDCRCIAPGPIACQPHSTLLAPYPSQSHPVHPLWGMLSPSPLGAS